MLPPSNTPLPAVPIEPPVLDVEPPSAMVESPPVDTDEVPPVEVLPPNATAAPPVDGEFESSSPPESFRPQPTPMLEPASNTARTPGACFNMAITFRLCCGSFATHPEKRARLITV